MKRTTQLDIKEDVNDKHTRVSEKCSRNGTCSRNVLNILQKFLGSTAWPPRESGGP